MNDYALSKWVNEMQIRNSRIQHGTQTVIVRLFNTYGPGEWYHAYRSVNAKFCYHALTGLPVTVYRGHYRTSTYLLDTCRTLANIADRFNGGETYNIVASSIPLLPAWFLQASLGQIMTTRRNTVLITGSSGLIGSEAVEYFDQLGWDVHGIDNNMRADFFGPDGDTTRNLTRLLTGTKRFTHHAADIRDRTRILSFFQEIPVDLVVHAAAQPSHDLAASRPFDDFDVNAVGTMNMLEATRLHRPDAVFCFMSTNKVYGDAPNELPLREFATRWDYERDADYGGIDEHCRIDQSTHSVFGASKVAADVMVQEYGRYFGLKTACFRGGCLTGSRHSAAELHGFLAYLMRATAEGRKYRIFGYKGKQVRDNIHSYDVCRLLHEFFVNPRAGEVYNLGGGRQNSVSMLEAIERAERSIGKKLDWTYVDEPRTGDHMCYISNLSKLQTHFPAWSITKSLDDIFDEMAASLHAVSHA